MDQTQAKRTVVETFTREFDRDRYLRFIQNLLNHLDASAKRRLRQAGPYIKKAFQDKIRSFERVGTYTDLNGQTLDVLIVKLQKETTLERARTFQRNFVADYLAAGHGKDKDAVLAAFVSPTEEDWRFSFIKLEYLLEETESGQIKEHRELTPARRLSFLVGTNEQSHTAQKQFLSLLQNDLSDPALSEIEEAFQIEKVTKEFFGRYRDLYTGLRQELDHLVKKDEKLKKEFQSRTTDSEEFVANFSKKLLGQIVFLYFLQKKGWFGVGRDEEWGSGNKQFLRHLFSNRFELGGKSGKSSRSVNFFNDILEPLFYEALAKPKDYDFYSRFHCKIPFLNGGLFEPIFDYNWVHTDILLPDTLFSNEEPTDEGDFGTGILDVFDRFNFTVNEAEPLEKEVAVDPEMLGKVFENLLPENERKGKGTYYTPRVIVHYMCQQGLINYLANHLADYSVSRSQLETFIHMGERFGDFEASPTQNHQNKLLPEEIRENAKRIDELLEDITVCDPAIGSGAFPVVMMQEIVRARVTVAAIEGMPKHSVYELKRHAIQNSLYGVDEDPGAVEIAKLRLWLSLIVDEDNFKNIRPLPNLDYKIMQGNSLLNEFEGETLLDENLLAQSFTDLGADVAALNERINELQGEFFELDRSGIREKSVKQQFGKDIERLKVQRRQLLSRTGTTIGDQGSFNDLHSEARRALLELNTLHKQFFDSSSPMNKGEIKKSLDEIEWKFMEASLRERNKLAALKDLKELRHANRKPFFLWKLQFTEIFQARNGFDIVIANPPYGIEYNQEFKAAYERLYPAFNRNNDVYVAFYQLALQLMAPHGQLCYISPNTFLNGDYFKNLRRVLSEQTRIHEVIDYKQNPVFDVPTVFVCVLLAEKAACLPTQYEATIKIAETSIFDFQTKRVVVQPGTERKFKAADPISESLLANPDSTPLESMFLVKDIGFNYWTTGKGKKRDGNSIGDRVLYSGSRKNKEDRPFLKGRDLIRWGYSKPQNWLRNNYQQFLNPEIDTFRFSVNFFERNPKIIYRQTANTIIAALDESCQYLDKTVHVIVPKTDWRTIPAKLLLGLLNSRLYAYIYGYISQETKGRAFAQVKTTYIKQLPIPKQKPAASPIIERLVEYLIYLTGLSINDTVDLSESRDQLMISYFEQIIDALVYELFLSEELHKSGKHFFKPLSEENLPNLDEIVGDKLVELRRVFRKLFDQDHIVRQNIFFLDTLESVRIIGAKHETLLD